VTGVRANLGDGLTRLTYPLLNVVRHALGFVRHLPADTLDALTGFLYALLNRLLDIGHYAARFFADLRGGMFDFLTCAANRLLHVIGGFTDRVLRLLTLFKIDFRPSHHNLPRKQVRQSDKLA
jgi:hypothetical protein